MTALRRGTSRLCAGACGAAVVVASLGSGGATVWGSTRYTVQPVPGTFLLQSVACASSKVCVATAMSSSNKPEAFPLSLQRQKVTVGAGVAGGGVGQVACPTSNLCETVKAGGPVQAFEVTSSGLTAESPVQTKVAGGGVACPSSDTCIEVGVESSGKSAAVELHVTSTKTTVGEPVKMPGAVPLDAIACPSAELCIAAGATSTGSTAKAVLVPIGLTSSGLSVGAAQDVKGASNLTGIACPTATLCVAVGGTSPGPDTEGAAVDVTVSGSTVAAGKAVHLTTFATSDLWAVACPSSALCEATGSWPKGTDDKIASGVVAVTQSGGEPALGPASVVQGDWGEFENIACPKPSTCVAVGLTKSGQTGAVVSFAPSQ